MDLNNYKTKLTVEKKLLEEELLGIGKVDKTGDWKAKPEDDLSNQEVEDFGDQADKATDFEERSSKLNLLELRLNDIDKALEKIENKNYGNCEICEKKIEEDRLEVNPAAPTCKECMEKNV